jgi:phosphoenolpyruvate-protein phosphotransferase
LSVPAVVSGKFKIEEIQENTLAILNGTEGFLQLNPDKEQVTQAREDRRKQEEIWGKYLSMAHKSAITLDGKPVEVVSNIGTIEEAKVAIELGAEGIGLLRTEFLYLDNDELPPFEQQVNAYKEIAAIMGDRPIVVRTLDIGGDKDVPYLDFMNEANPFLGWRAIRMIDERPDIFEVQIRALLTGFQDSDLRIMVPMISQLEEVILVKRIFKKVADELEQKTKFVHPKLQFGIMVEVPSTALMVEILAEHVDFFSIGTNDLTQYTMAIDRTNERVAGLASPFNPAVIRLISMTIKGAHKKNCWVGLCGEMAGNPLAIPLLLGFGLDEFSMAPSSIPRIKHIIRYMDIKKCQKIAQEVMNIHNTEGILTFLSDAVSHLDDM